MDIELVKLEHFSKDIMDDVSEKTLEIETEVDAKLKKDFDEKEIKYLEEAYNIIQSGLKQIDREKNEVISKTSMENKIKLLNKRKEIMDEALAKAKSEIALYTKTEKYKEDLIAKIKKHMAFMGEGKYVVYINYNDKELYHPLQEMFKNAKIFIERRHIDMVGGVKLHNTTTNMYIDDSFAKRFEDEEEGFLQYCGIEIENEVGDEVGD